MSEDKEAWWCIVPKTIRTTVRQWRVNGTKIIGYVTGTIAAVAGVDGVIPPAHLKYYMAVMSVLTVWRGFINTKASKDASSADPTA